MLLLVLVSQFVVQPMLAEIRAQVNSGDIMSGALADDFALWHSLAGGLYLLLCVFGLALAIANAIYDPR